MTKEEREIKIDQLKKLKDRFYVKYRRLQDEINELTQHEYDDMRVYRTGERQLDTRIDGNTVLA